MTRYLRIFALYFQHVFQHRARNFMWFLIAFINPLVLLLFWQGILTDNHKLQGWNLTSIRTYYLLLIIAQAALMNHVELIVAYVDIKQGELLRELLKPFSYFTMRVIAELPWRMLQAIYALVIVTSLVLILKVPLTLTHSAEILVLAIFVSINAYLISFFFKMVLGLLAFWMTNIDSVLETNDVLIIALSGLIIPINLFPKWLLAFAHFTPFPYMLYYPIGAFIGMYDTAELLRLISIQFGWIVGFFILCKLMWRSGLRKFSGVGQ